MLYRVTWTEPARAGSIKDQPGAALPVVVLTPDKAYAMRYYLRARWKGHAPALSARDGSGPDAWTMDPAPVIPEPFCRL